MHRPTLLASSTALILAAAFLGGCNRAGDSSTPPAGDTSAASAPTSADIAAMPSSAPSAPVASDGAASGADGSTTVMLPASAASSGAMSASQ